MSTLFSTARRRRATGLATLALAGLAATAPGIHSQTQAIPRIADMTPKSVAPGASDFTVTVRGTGLLPGQSRLAWNGVELANTVCVAAATPQLASCSASVPAANVATRTTAAVTVINPGGTGVLISDAAYLTVTTVLPARPSLVGQSATGGWSASLTMGDFNRDGVLDAATANLANGQPGDSVTVMLGNDSGVFATSQTIAMPPASANRIESADMNEDGILDLVVYWTQVTVLLGHGDGTFAPGIATTTLGGHGEPLAIADFTGDGHLDVAVQARSVDASTGTSTSFIYLLTGDGTGALTLADTLSEAGGAGTGSMAAGDFDSDGRIDLAVTKIGAYFEEPGRLAIMAIDAAGAMTERLSLPTGGSPGGLRAADFNADGVLDLIAVNLSDHTFAIYNGDGTGNFTAAAPLSTGLTGYERFAVADLDGDGFNDIAVTGCRNTSCNNGTVTLINDGAGSFTSSLVGLFHTSHDDLELVDVTGDGRLDYVMANGRANAVLVHAQTAQVDVSATSIDFGSQPYQTPSAPRPLTLTVTGSAPLSISKVTVTGDFTIGSGSTCPTAGYVEPGVCTFDVIFTPSAEGNRAGTLTIEESHRPQSRVIELRGRDFPNFTLDPSSTIDFGLQSVGVESAPRTFRVVSIDDGPLVINGMSGGGDFRADYSACPAIILPRTSCEVSVTFTPSVTGPVFTQLSVNTNAGSRNVGVIGNGYSGVADLSPAALTFAPRELRTTSAPQTVTLTNTHARPLVINGIGIGGPYASEYPIVGGSCPLGASTLAPAASCTIDIAFRPAGRGTRTATLSLSAQGGLSDSTAISGVGLGNGIPFITQIAPASIAPGSGDTPLAIAGAGFVPGAQVLVNGAPVATTFTDAGHLTATIPAATLATAKTASLAVRQPTPGGEVSNIVSLPIAATAAPIFTRTDLPIGTAAQSTAIADFNGDGIADLASTMCGSNLGMVDPPPCAPGAVVLRLGTGGGSFGAPRTIELPNGRSADRIIAADFNSDGRMDLAVGQSSPDWNYMEGRLSVLLGDGAGQFTIVDNGSANFSMCATGDLVAADFSRDGNLDLALVDAGCGRSGVWEGDGTGYLKYSIATEWAFASLYTDRDVPPAVTDLNGDGILDIAAVSFSSFAVFVGDATGTFPSTGYLFLDDMVKGLAAADVNRDGHADIVMVTQPWFGSGYTLGVYLGDGTAVTPDGNAAFTLAQSIPMPGVLRAPVIADLNNDGLVDLAVASDNNTVTVLLGDGTGQFTPSGAPLAVGATPHSLAVADINGDGRLDLLTTNYADGSVTMLTRVAATLTPTVTFTGAPANASYGDTFVVTARTNAGVLPVIEATGACSVSATGGNPNAATATVTMTRSSGICSLAAKWPASGLYKAATAAQSTRAWIALSNLAITTSPSPSLVGQPVTVTFTVAGNGTPTGSVGVLASGGELCTATLTGGTGSCVITFTRIGTVTLLAAYTGDENFLLSLATRSHTVNGPMITLTTPSFGSVKVGRTVTDTVKISNTGNAPATITGVSIGAPGNALADYAVTNACGPVLAAKASCNVTVRFTARTVGVKTATLIVTTNAAASPHTAPLTATVVR